MPTGLEAYCQSERSQHQNRAAALSVLAARVHEAAQRAHSSRTAHVRRAQLGSGQRGDKRRTVRLQDGRVTDHVTGRRWDATRYLAGAW